MAEVAAAALATEQVVATTVEAGAAAVAVAVPTQPLKATLSKIGASAANDKTLALARAHHTVTVIGDKAYVFGGSGPDDELCSNDIHAFTLPGPNRQAEYACYPAFPLKDSAGGTYAPAPRTHHAACSRGNQLIIHGGRDARGNFIDDGLTLWIWDSEHLKWTKTTPDIELYTTFAPRSDHHIFVDQRQDILVLHGGQTTADRRDPHSQETWLYDFKTNTWTTMPSSPAPASSAAYAAESLYTISGDSSLGGSINYLKLQHSEEAREKRDALVWHTVNFPSNPLTPGPEPREGGVLVPVTTGMGRNYLIYMLGKKAEGGTGKSTSTEDVSFVSDIWSLQLPAAGLTPARFKDVIREKLVGWETGAFTWAQVQIDSAEDNQAEGSVQPSPREFVGADSCLSGKGVMLWGGATAKGKLESDGWILKIQ